MVYKYENLLFDMFCDEMFSALDNIGYTGDDGFVKEVMDVMDDCIVKKICRDVGIYVRQNADERRKGTNGSVRISVFDDEFCRPVEERLESGSVLILYAHLSISRYGIIDMNLYEDIEIWS